MTEKDRLTEILHHADRLSSAVQEVPTFASSCYGAGVRDLGMHPRFADIKNLSDRLVVELEWIKARAAVHILVQEESLDPKARAKIIEVVR